MDRPKPAIVRSHQSDATPKVPPPALVTSLSDASNLTSTQSTAAAVVPSVQPAPPPTNNNNSNSKKSSHHDSRYHHPHNHRPPPVRDSPASSYTSSHNNSHKRSVEEMGQVTSPPPPSSTEPLPTPQPIVRQSLQERISAMRKNKNGLLARFGDLLSDSEDDEQQIPTRPEPGLSFCSALESFLEFV